ncbi:hypothetical protein H112_07480 [Trichophyton rubrum D6]|uniref:Uncharacterized protein n=3 Tax=Trichophyton rubrum TaxID=5551 RepID=A0A178EWJ9_TRIRU|nr:uncharacterized protein TERG_00085 [Trichophyton rubrum CBS 118892]EZF11470.1 hypothetical protein H100_07505 [Trichophyton rubrum MR850]EZF38315.1 hypothetical protein H102_07469 [Trichophyton rubrum CBS 100081]EZF48932.1 hypothetical protein H103_07493 [Trichophyton rubrum CBS 288.86]EZF59580.1 hypothetical protein H104_07441 [Trichophyton rubrum CBS 289.86]EZF80815.1 hypothetical protein H110_07488 [Trichophyton rubrum MR1448]EZF91466.1 hypothetical protein H113_07547 [Trichophyton rubr
MPGSNKIPRTRDDSPAAQLFFDLKTIAKRTAAKRIGSESVNQSTALRESFIPESSCSANIPSTSLLHGDETAETSKGKLRRPQRYPQRRLRGGSKDIYDLDVDSPGASKMKSVTPAKHADLTVGTESSEDDDSGNSYVESGNMIGTGNPPENNPSDIPLVIIDNAPTSLLTDKAAINREHVHVDDSNYGEKLTISVPDSDYEYTNTDEDEDEDKSESNDEEEDVLETLEHEEVIQQIDAVDNGPDSEISFTDVYSQDYLRDDADFWDASRIFDQERNWHELISEAHLLMQQQKGLEIESTKNLFRSVSNGIDAYRERISASNSRGNFASTDTEESLLETLEKGVSQVMVESYPYNADSPSKLTTLVTLAYEVAAGIIPGMIGLLQWCLVAHYSNDSVTDNGTDQLVRILDSVERLCEVVQAEPPKPPPGLAAQVRIISVLVRFMAYVFRQQLVNTRQPTTHQHADRFRNPEPSHDKYDESVGSEEPTSVLNEGSSWSRAESETLFDALRKYQGPERYELILREFRDTLGHRSIDELRKKTVETRAGLLALPDERRPHYSQWSFLDD